MVNPTQIFILFNFSGFRTIILNKKHGDLTPQVFVTYFLANRWSEYCMTAIKAGWAAWAGLLGCRRLHSNQYGKKFAHETLMSSGTNYRLSISLLSSG